MYGKEFREALHRGDRVYGTYISSTSPVIPERLKKINLDFVFLDTEHFTFNREVLFWMCLYYHAMSVAPLVRIPTRDPSAALNALDGGACGIIVPYVESVEQVRDMVGAVKYRPVQGKKLKDLLSGREKCDQKLQTYLDNKNQHNSLIVQIESVAGMEALDDILEVPGLDAVFIGPNDLSCSLDIPDQYSHPLFDEAVCTIIRKCRSHGVGIGIQWSQGIEPEIRWGHIGLHMFSHKSDLTAIAEMINKDRDILYSGLTDKEK